METVFEIRDGVEAAGGEVRGISEYKNQLEGKRFDVGGVDGCGTRFRRGKKVIIFRHITEDSEFFLNTYYRNEKDREDVVRFEKDVHTP